jgi:hypothetical protein
MALPRTFLARAVVGTVAVLVLSGCSESDEPEPTADPVEPSVAEPTESTPPDPAETDDEVTIDFASEGEATISCRSAFREYVEFEQLTSDTDVELVSATATQEGAARLGRVWVALDAEDVKSAGLLAVQARGPQITDEAGWDTKVPVAGAEVEADVTYTLFAEYDLPRDASGSSIRDLTLTYVADDGEGTATWSSSVVRRPCP